METRAIFMNLILFLKDLKSILKINFKRLSILTQVKIIAVSSFELCTVKSNKNSK
ncbi:hypothetical protein ACM55F_15485 [Flavobacterium sp. XS2P12]|uniref:hypothetical protein n=1 Tax=Flavobacterium melibiosi TaxID=3398734 RepID=UPI003A8B98FC